MGHNSTAFPNRNISVFNQNILVFSHLMKNWIFPQKVYSRKIVQSKPQFLVKNNFSGKFLTNPYQRRQKDPRFPLFERTASSSPANTGHIIPQSADGDFIGTNRHIHVDWEQFIALTETHPVPKPIDTLRRQKYSDKSRKMKPASKRFILKGLTFFHQSWVDHLSD